jgi:hypothetical protein
LLAGDEMDEAAAITGVGRGDVHRRAASAAYGIDRVQAL